MEDPAREAEHDRGRHERATDGDQPARIRVPSAQSRPDEQRQSSHNGEADQPPGLVAERRIQQPERTR